MTSTSLRPAIDETLEGAIASGAVPNVVAVAADRHGIVYERGIGPRSPDDPTEVDTDSHFRITSMTEMVVTVVALALMEQYKLDIDAPVEEYCPEFAGVQVLERIQDGRPVLRPPARKATLKHLITHTSGLGYWFWDPDVLAWERAVKAPNVLSGSRRIFEAPMVCDPGTRFVYGIGTDWLGRAVEAICDRPLDEIVTTMVTEPLGMSQTGFVLDDDRLAGVVPVHLRGDDGSWAGSEIELQRAPDYWSAGHGLYSTPSDYLKFQRMLLGDGTSPDGATLLARETVDAAFADQIDGLEFPAEIPAADPASTFGLEVGPEHTWGHGLLVNTADQPGRRRAGSGAWAGFFNTHFWVDRATGVTGAIYAQMLPFLPPDAMRMYQEFETALYASL
jgi:methyl acetate hydrolase